MTNSHRIVRRAAGLTFAGVALVFAAHTADAQASSAGGRWTAWLGCWKPMSQVLSATPTPRVCVIGGASSSSVDIVTVDSGKIVSRYAVDASGAQRSVDREGCTGWERARWSSDSLRVFLKSELMCGATRRTSSGIMSITPSGDWVDVQTVTAGGNEAVRAVRYVESASREGLPPEVTAVVADSRRLGARAALIAAGVRVTGHAILEATKAVDTSAVQAWLVERGQSFIVSARDLVLLADAGVPGSVTDVLVALANPNEFHFNRDAATNVVEPLSRSDSARIASTYLRERAFDCGVSVGYSPFGWGTDPCYGYRYGYGAYRYGYGYGYSPYGAYGYSPYDQYYGYYTRPVVIVRNSEPDPHGVAVNGRGYTRNSSGSSGSSASRSGYSGGESSSASSSRSSSPATSSGGSSSSSSSSGSSSSGSSSSGSSSSSSSSGRTAVARPPQL